MSDKSLLVQVASCLGNSYRNEQHYSGETSSASLVATTALENDHDVSVVCSSLSFPSLSLSHHPERQNREEVHSPTREEIKMKASACMSRLITENDPSLRSLERDISRRLLENILDSFDQLVDARISQYSKVLSNHGLSLSTKGAQIVEYKLRTLLEIGTNITFGSISTKFESSEMTATTTRTTADGDKCTTELPVMLTVEIDSLRFHRPMSSDTLLSGNVLQHHDPDKLTFRARGTMQGISNFKDCACSKCCHGNMVTTTARGSIKCNCIPPTVIATPPFEKLILQVDCEALLKEMMEGAGQVVGLVVELTNEAWSESQSVRTFHEEEEETVGSIHRSRQENPVAKSPTSPRIGAKTVSEPELSKHQSDDDLNEPQGGEIYAESRIYCDRNRSIHPFLHPGKALDSDEENMNPSISAEKACHIIDYVFDEIADEFTPPPPPKRVRVDLPSTSH